MQQCLRLWAPLPCARFRTVAPPCHARTNVRARPDHTTTTTTTTTTRSFATAKYDATNELFDLIASNESSEPVRIDKDVKRTERDEEHVPNPDHRQPYDGDRAPVAHGRRGRHGRESSRYRTVPRYQSWSIINRDWRIKPGVRYEDGEREKRRPLSKEGERTTPSYKLLQRTLAFRPPENDKLPSELNAIWDKTHVEIMKQSRDGGQIDVQKLDIDSRAAHWVDIFLSKVPGESMWMHSALWLQANDPDRIPDFLLATHHAPYPPGKFVSLSLQFLAQHYVILGGDVAARGCTRILEALSILAARDADDKLMFLGSFPRLLIRHLSGEQIVQLFDTISTHSISVSWRTMLSLTTHLATHGDIKRAIDAYLQAHHLESHRPVDESRQICTYLLRSAINQPDGLQECLRLCSKLGEIGLQPDTQMANVLVLNAVQAGQVKTAMDLYSTLFAQNLEPDDYTLGILIKAYKQDRSAAIPLESIVNMARARGILWTNRVVATDIFLAGIQSVIEQHPDAAWYQSWQLFDEIFDTAPLLKLGLPPPQGYENRSRSHNVQQASLQAIRAMLDVYLQLQRQDGRSTSAVLSLWKQFQALVSAGDPTFVQLARTDHCYNLFLYAFALNKQTLLNATEVIKDMQTPLPDSLGVKKCTPTDQSWNIFLLGFRVHGLEKLAEQVLQHMQSEGIKPSQIAWEQLAHGYADAQDLDGLLSVLSRADQSGAVWTEWMDHALGSFKDQHRLQQALIEERINQPTDFMGDLRNSLIAKLDTSGDESSAVGELQEATHQDADQQPFSHDAVGQVLLNQETVSHGSVDQKSGSQQPFGQDISSQEPGELAHPAISHHNRA